MSANSSERRRRKKGRSIVSPHTIGSIVLILGFGSMVSLAGCTAPGPQASPQATSADVSFDDVVHDSERLTFRGTAKPQPGGLQNAPNGQEVGLWHSFDVPDDVTSLLAEVEHDPERPDVWLALYGPDGVQIQAPSKRIVVPPIQFQESGPGTYKLEAFTRPPDTSAPYEATVALIRATPTARSAMPVPATPRSSAEVVVAVIDSGLNVYHEAFRRADGGVPAPDAVDATTGKPTSVVDITLGPDQGANLWLDDGLWRSLERGTLYRFPGTRVLGISMSEDGGVVDQYPVLDERLHGTATAASVLKSAPDATIVMVEMPATATSPITWEQVVPAIEWAAAQPWIDVLSVSMGNAYNTPAHRIQQDDTDADLRVPQAVLKAVRSGKLFINSAGNDPTLSWTDHPDGPPWAISVSGVDPRTQGRTTMSSQGADYVSDFGLEVPVHDATNGTRWIQGTSVAAPHVAGAFADVILELRRATGHTGGISPAGAFAEKDGSAWRTAELRAAFNASAVYWEAQDYRPLVPQGSVEPWAVGSSAPILPAPHLQMGWGYIDGAIADAVARLLIGGGVPPAKPADAVAYMEAQYAAREAYWQARLEQSMNGDSGSLAGTNRV